MHVPPGRRIGDDAGIGLIEVVVAMVVFGLIATGIISAVSISLKMTPDNEAREVAANLAAQEIDLVRAVGDPYQVGDRTTMQTINGRVYTIARDTGWISAAGIGNTCGDATANFELRVNVDVSWNDQSANTSDIRSDTLLAPTTQLTDAKTGALALYVVDRYGQPQAGVTVVVAVGSPASGAVTPTSQPPVTNSDGCAYLGKLAPGNYKATITRVGSTDLSGRSQISDNPIAVIAGATTAHTFPPYTGSVSLVRDDGDNTDGQALIATDLVVSYFRTNAFAFSSSNASVSAQYDPAGYTAVAGKLGTSAPLVTCPEFDPGQWGAGVSNGKAVKNGEREAAVAPATGKSHLIGVPMGTVSLQNVKGLWLKAVQATPAGSGNPGCSTATTILHFTQAPDDTVELALPYGTWSLFEGATSDVQATPVVQADVTGTSNDAGGGVTATTVTLDPRLK